MEKEEELNNNMMTNGKAKEYIDNLVKLSSISIDCFY